MNLQLFWSHTYREHEIHLNTIDRFARRRCRRRHSCRRREKNPSVLLSLIRLSPFRSANAQHQSHDPYRSSARNRISDNYRNTTTNNNSINHDDSQCAATCDSSSQREAHQAKKPLNNIGDIAEARQEAGAEFRRPSGLSCSSSVHPLSVVSFRPNLLWAVFVRSLNRSFVRPSFDHKVGRSIERKENVVLQLEVARRKPNQAIISLG